ncbi:MAG: response regulator [Ignavibacteriales bacterium]|nr:response regulator [Ignavibacteriales bacterium]
MIVNRKDNRPTVLVVEDEDVLVELLRGMLEANGFSVITATDGAEAVDIYRKNRKDIAIVLTDMGLPSKGGWEVLEEVLKMNPAAKVICASGFLDSAIRDEMLAAGAVEFIQKPYAYDSLIALMRQLLDAKS